MKLSAVKINPNNPRLIRDDKFQKLVQSLKEFPEMMTLRPMIIDKTNMVLGGNMRRKALQELGYTEIPDTWIKKASELTPDQIRRFIIADNVQFGEHDWTMLAAEWDPSQLADWGLDMPELETQPEAKEDNYELPEVIKTDIITGDLFEIGPHRLLCGDSRDPEDWKRLMAGKLADLVVTDPPYNVDYTGATKDQLKINGDKQSDGDFYTFLLNFYTALGEYTKPGGGVVRVACRQRRRQLPHGNERQRPHGQTMPDMGKEFNGHGPPGLPMET